MKEYEEVLIRPKFGFPRKRVKRLLQKLRTKGKVVKLKTSVKVLKDPADNKFLECALSGKANYFVSGKVGNRVLTVDVIESTKPRKKKVTRLEVSEGDLDSVIKERSKPLQFALF